MREKRYWRHVSRGGKIRRSRGSLREKKVNKDINGKDKMISPSEEDSLFLSG